MSKPIRLVATPRRAVKSNPFLTVQQIQNVTGMSSATVYRWVYYYGLKSFRTRSGRILVHAEDLKQFLVENYHA